MSNRKPNILWIFSDQHRPHAISCYGDENISTPHLDRLANEGIRFVNAYSNTPLCAPFRASLYTGKYMTTHGVISLHRPLLGHRMLVEELQSLGYYTSHFGKWHLSGGASPCAFASPHFRPGWDEWCGWENSNQPWDTKYTINNSPNVHTLPGYQTDALTDLTVEWIKKQPEDRPWFHVMSVEPPHGPHTAPEAYMDMFKNSDIKLRPNVEMEHPKLKNFIATLRAYYAQIANLDYNVGRIIRALEEKGELDNTIIFYLSDHGDLMGSHGMTGKGRPEVESSQIPLIIRYPERIRAQMVSTAFISGVDMMPTLLGLLGAPIPDGVEGEDLSEAITGMKEEGAQDVLLQYEHSFYDPKPDQSFRTLIQSEYAYTYFLTKGPSQLFHQKEDPFQLNNLIHDEKYAEIRKEMHESLRLRLDRIKDDFLERAERLGD